MLIDMEDVEYACLDFTTVEENMGVVNVVNLIPNGESVDVTDKNLMHYLETIVQYRLVTRIETPNIDNKDWMDHTRYSGIFGDRYGLHQVCKWFWEVVQDMDEEHRAKLLQFVTGTSGIPGKMSIHYLCCCVSFHYIFLSPSFFNAIWYRGVAKGFSVLQGNDGELRLFEIHGVKIETCLYPRAQ